MDSSCITDSWIEEYSYDRYKRWLHYHSKVEDDSELLKVLDTNLLEAVATLFGIRLEWLEGGTDELYDINHFYKQPQKFGE